MLIHQVPAGEQFLEIVEPDGHRDRQTQWPTRANIVRRPSPRTRTCWRGSMPEFFHLCRIGRQSDEMLRDRLLVLGLVEEPLPGGLRVGDGFPAS